MLDRLPHPIIFAHRGASLYAPENTLAAYELAVRQGADGVEMDAKLTSDGEVVLFHDLTLERTTGMEGKLAAHSLAELRRLDAGSHFDIAFRGEPIPTLDETFKALARQIFINVELTNYASPLDKLPEKVAELVKKHHLENWVMFSSFNPVALIRIRRLLPNVPIGLLAMAGSQGRLARSRLGHLLSYQALHPWYQDASPDLIQRIHKRGKLVSVYTVNQAEAIRNLAKINVDGIFTDDPVLAKQALVRSKSKQQTKKSS
jgi:glycerophosphoryl diester phosphodiesterase